jgi:glycosyltransferase involved in cell wall biosynthesis
LTSKLKELCFDLNLSGYVYFPGMINPATSVWRTTDLAVHSSVTEGCPNAVLEAMSYGLPVCGTRISGIIQAVGERNARFLSPPGDAADLSSKMGVLLRDHKQRAEYGDANQKRIAEYFSREQLSATVLDLIYTKLAGPRSAMTLNRK